MSTVTEELLETFETVTAPCDIGRHDSPIITAGEPCQEPAIVTATIHDCRYTGGSPVILCESHTQEAIREATNNIPGVCGTRCGARFLTASDFIWNILPLHPKAAS